MTVWRAPSALILLAWLCAAGCRPAASPEGLRPSARTSSAPGYPAGVPASSPLFTEAAAAGITFRHRSGGHSPLNILQTIGSGCAFFDYDNDGWPDIYLVNSHGPGALYHNDRGGRFTDVTDRAGVAGRDHYGIGCAAGDYDGDGRPDLFVTGCGRNVLYHNNGDGTFADVARKAGVEGAGWSTSAAFGDYDGDGWLDLYVAHYVLFDRTMPQLCPLGTQGRVMGACSPIIYLAEPGVLYHNNGNGTFTDVTSASGVSSLNGRGLGVLWVDYDEDGRPDLYVANDMSPDNLFRNLGDGRFRDAGTIAGVAYGPTGIAEASMGVDAGDYDNDGHLDLFHTNFQNEGAALFHYEGRIGFLPAADRAGVLAVTRPLLGFGAGFFDYDNDGHLDLFIANGHVQDTIGQVDAACSFAQPRLLLHNRGNGGFEDVSRAAGEALTSPAVGRGVAFADYDHDGAVDVLVNNNGGPAMLLHNETGRRRSWLRLCLEGRDPNRFAVGARVTLLAGGLHQVREIHAGHSYASSSDLHLNFGLGGRPKADRVIVRWPGGKQTVLQDLPAGREVTVRER